MFTDTDDDFAAARQSALGAGAAAKIRSGANGHPLRDTAFDHVRAQCRRVEVHKALVHDGGAFAQVGTESDAAGISDAYACRNHVVHHFGELIDREDLQVEALCASVEQRLGQFSYLNRSG